MKQGSEISGFIFNFLVDWMRNINNSNRGFLWKLKINLEDLNYDNDLSLLSRRVVGIQEKFIRLYGIERYTDLTINIAKMNTMRENNEWRMWTFAYLGATLDKMDGNQAEIKRMLFLARAAYVSLNKIWKSPK